LPSFTTFSTQTLDVAKRDHKSRTIIRRTKRDAATFDHCFLRRAAVASKPLFSCLWWAFYSHGDSDKDDAIRTANVNDASEPLSIAVDEKDYESLHFNTGTLFLCADFDC